METTSPANLDALFGHAAGEGLADAARTFLRRRREKAEAEARLKAAQQALDAAEAELLRQCDEAGVLSVKVELDGQPASCVTSTSDYYGVPAGTLEDTGFLRWLLRAGGQDLVRRTCHHMSLSAFCRELAAQGRALHPAVKKTQKRLVRVTAAR